MKPKTAARLVGQYARLTREIRLCKKQIGEALDGCRGLKGFRLETETHPGCSGNKFFDAVPPCEMPTQRAQHDQDTHLKGWYTPVDLGPDECGFLAVTAEHQAECPHCYAAHLVIQRRKELRRKLASVKAAMTRYGDS